MEHENGMRNMTVGSPAGHIFYFALPLLAGSFLQQLYNMVDSWVVGNYAGDAALAAVGVGFPVIFMFTSLFMGLSGGGTVVIAQFYGAGNMDRVRDAVDTVYTAFMVSAIPITVIALGLVKPVLLLMQVKADAWAESWLYLTVVSAGLIGAIGYNLNAGILGGLGNSRTTLLFLAISSVMNIVLDLVFVLGCGMGVLGVALGTIISQAFSWLFGLFYINRHYPEIAIRPFCRRFDKALFRQIMGIGLPAGIQMSLVAIGAMVVMSKINSFGKEFAAAYNVGSKLDSLAFLPVQSLSNAVTSFVGQNIGAKRLDRARYPHHRDCLRGLVSGDAGAHPPGPHTGGLFLRYSRRHPVGSGVPEVHHALLFPVLRHVLPEQRHAGRRRQHVRHAGCHLLSDFGPCTCRLLVRRPLRPGLYVLRRRRGLDRGLHPVGHLLPFRPVEAEGQSGGRKSRLKCCNYGKYPI